MRRNLVQSLFEHSEIRTTVTKAREVRAFAEKLITLALKGSLAARQRAAALLGDRSVIPAEIQADYDRMSDAKRRRVLRSRSGRRYRTSTTRPGVKTTAESIVARLFATVAPLMKRRNESRDCAGGYTRLVKLGDRRVGDGAQLAILRLVGADDRPRPRLTDKTERKRRARVKYAFYAGKGLQRRGRSRGKSASTEGRPGSVAESGGEASSAG